MHITSSLAQQIVNAVHDVVGHDINFIDLSGEIIGSSDSTRIHQFHEAGFESIQKGTPIRVYDQTQYHGSKKGINYPIFFHDSAIASIGITGEPAELSRFGFLITKITEVFLKEQELNLQAASRQQLIQSFLTAFFYEKNKSWEQLASMANALNLNSLASCQVYLLSLSSPNEESSFRFFLKKYPDILSLYRYPNEYLLLYPTEKYPDFPSNIRYLVLHSSGTFMVGTGSIVPLREALTSYEEARLAMKHSSYSGKIFSTIEDIGLETLLSSVPSKTAHLFTKKYLSLLDKEEIHLLTIYFMNNLSLKQTSQQLYIHRNTLQYRLDRIEEKTGLNPRHFQDGALLNTLLLLNHLSEEK